MQDLLEPADALGRILAALSGIAPLAPERVPLRDALGRALADDLVTTRALPPFDCSQMDGYALRAVDAPKPGSRLPIAFEVFAGGPPPPPLPPGTCARVFTGSQVPRGADSVEMQEEVSRKGAQARFRRAVERGQYVRLAGSDISAGAVALRRGTTVDAGAIGLAAALGRTELVVFRRPHVGLLATGDELVPIDRPPAPGQILDSNSHALAAACTEAGGVPVLLPIARDNPAALAAALRAAEGCDALVSMGGVSVGEKDLVKEALSRAGTRLDFWRVAMRPGKPITFGLRGRTAVFGLPGNPASALVTHELFVRPALRKLAGLAGTGRAVLPARLASPFEKVGGLTYYVRARAWVERGALLVEPLRTQISGNLSSIVDFQALAILPKRATRLRRGTPVRTVLMAPPGEVESTQGGRHS